MATKSFMKKNRAKSYASKRRKMGYDAGVYKKKKGYGVSTTRKK